MLNELPFGLLTHNFVAFPMLSCPANCRWRTLDPWTFTSDSIFEFSSLPKVSPSLSRCALGAFLAVFSMFFQSYILFLVKAFYWIHHMLLDTHKWIFHSIYLRLFIMNTSRRRSFLWRSFLSSGINKISNLSRSNAPRSAASHTRRFN